MSFADPTPVVNCDTRIYSLLSLAKLNGRDPGFYLYHILERIADHPMNRIHELLPWNVSITSRYTIARR